MSRDPYAIDREAPPEAAQLSSLTAFFIVFGGPIAWFLQLCAGAALASWPCFPSMERLPAPIAGYHWTRAAAIVLLVLGAVVAIAAAMIALTVYRRLGDAERRRPDDPAWARTRFLSLWGMITGGGFSVATIATLVALIWLPRCAG